jgi:hypothetical protein
MFAVFSLLVLELVLVLRTGTSHCTSTILTILWVICFSVTVTVTVTEPVVGSKRRNLFLLVVRAAYNYHAV